MKSIYNDPLTAELKELTLAENVFINNLATVCDKVKNKVFNMVNRNENSLDSLRYIMHLRSKLAFENKLKTKKK